MDNNESRTNRPTTSSNKTAGGGFLLGLIFFLVLANTAGIGYLVYTTVVDKQATSEKAKISQSIGKEGGNVSSQGENDKQLPKTSVDGSSTLPSTTVSSDSKKNEGDDQKRTYTVQSGDTISDIAEKHQVTVEHLKTLNNLEDNVIQTGQVMKID